MRNHICDPSQLPPGATVYVFGAGASGETVAEILSSRSDLTVAGFIDNFRSGSVKNLPVINWRQFEEMPRPPGAVVLIASRAVAALAASEVQAPNTTVYDGIPLIERFQERAAARNQIQPPRVPEDGANAKRLWGMFGWREQFESVYYVQPLIYQAYAQLLASPRYADRRSLMRHGFKSYSQCDEDGILQEILRRIGTTNRIFLEIGVGNGQENNSVYLLLQGWSGVWVECNPGNLEAIRERFSATLGNGRLVLLGTEITRDNVNDVLRSATLLPAGLEIDLLSIDIDGNDHHVLSAIEVLRARVIVVEYNGKFKPPVAWAMPYNPAHRFDGTDNFGASLNAFDELLGRRGYSLVGCNASGTNAFFVRADLAAEELFQAPFTPECHFEPPRYFLNMGFMNELPEWSLAGWRANIRSL